ncbi:hypothetical protein KEM52_004214 [Ascosphaera acerosa]|nr:hypothetical protein KEM52_004214 [Ascosphaera acerosa]
MSALTDRPPATTLSAVVATALIAGVTGYFIGRGASIGIFSRPRTRTRTSKTGEGGRRVDGADDKHAGSERDAADDDASDDASDDDASDSNDSDEEVIGDLANFDAVHDDVKLVLVVRTDLGMTKGKIAAQCSHATLACYKTLLASPVQQALLARWERQGQPKIALQVRAEDDLLMLQAQAMSLGLCARVIRDAGRTQIASGSMTVLGVLGPRGVVDSVTGSLKLL